MLTDLIGMAELRARFKVSRPTFWRWLKRGLFPKPCARIGQKNLWRESVVERFLLKSTKGGAR